MLLAWFDLGDADRVFVFFTKKFGKVAVKARGIRRPQAKLRSQIDFFRVVELELAEGRSFYALTGAVAKEVYSGLENDLQSASVAYFLLETLTKLLPDGAPQVASYHLLRGSLEALDKKYCEADVVRYFFLLSLWQILGWGLSWDRCASCRTELKEVCCLNLSEERIWCEKCATGRENLIRLNPGVGRDLSSGQLDILRSRQLSELEKDVLQKIVRHFRGKYFNEEMKSEEFMRFACGKSN